MEIRGTHQYPKIYALGSAEVISILNEPVEVTEKVDGSQIGFGVIDGELIIRSKGALINQAMPPKMFHDAVAYIRTIKDRLEPGFFHYGECLQTPRHNRLKYGRVPLHNVALFGVKDDRGVFWNSNGVAAVAEELGFDCVPELFFGECTMEKLESLLNTPSFLGGEIEGLVIDSCDSGMKAKLVRPEFKEVKVRKECKARPVGGIEETVREAFRQFCTEARWDKAIQHLAEDGIIVGSNSDIGPLIKEIHRDVLEEEGEYVKEMLWSLYRKRFLSAVVDGFPRYYQDKLIERAREAA